MAATEEERQKVDVPLTKKAFLRDFHTAEPLPLVFGRSLPIFDDL